MLFYVTSANLYVNQFDVRINVSSQNVQKLCVSLGCTCNMN
jgi:hypothetical protein